MSLKRWPILKKILPYNRAIHFQSRVFRGKFLKFQLFNESAMVADNSMAVLEEFERFEEDFPISGLGGQVMGSEKK